MPSTEHPAVGMAPEPARVCPEGPVAILGLGNPLLTDDAVGLAVADACERLLAARPLPGVDVLRSTRGGFELIDLLRGYGRAVILDCLDVPAPRPGRVHRLGLGQVRGSARLVGAHDLSLGDVFALAAQLAIPMPAEVEIFAVEAADPRTLGQTLTPAVAAAVEPLARTIHAELRQALARGEGSCREGRG